MKLVFVLARVSLLLALMPFLPTQSTLAVPSSTPGRPSAVAVSVSEVDVTWSPSADPSVTTYRIYRNGRLVGTIPAAKLARLLKHADTQQVQPSTKYTYRVEALNAAGAIVGDPITVAAKTPGRPETPDTTPPTHIHDFTATPIGAGTILLDWFHAHDDTDVTAYRLYRCIGSVQSCSEELLTVDGGTLRYVDTTALPGTTYTYMIEAFDVVGQRSHRHPAQTTPHDDSATLEEDGLLNEPTQAAVLSQSAQTTELAAATTATYSASLRRYPYLTDVVAQYATINWATDRSATTGSLKWGQVNADGSCTPSTSVSATFTNLTVNSVLEYQWKALLTLSPGTQYCYRVFLGATDLLGADPSPRFWTQVPKGSTEPFSFAVFGDWGSVDSTGSNPHQANVMQQIAASGARFALVTGDTAYPSGSQNNYGDLVETGSSISGIFGPAFWKAPGATIPLFPATGNHGFASTNLLHPHLQNWPQDRAVASSSGQYVRKDYCCLNGTVSKSYPDAWYAFDAGPARFYVINTAWDEANLGTANQYKNDYDNHWPQSSPQYQWLENDLKTHSAALKFAFFHYPIYSDSGAQPSDTYLQGPASLEGLLGTYGVNLAFTGHSHMYQRNYPNGDGLVTYVTGGGGARLGIPSNCSGIDAYAIGWSYTANNGAGGGRACGSAPVPSAIDQVFHFLLVRVEGTTVTVTPTDELGRTFDVQSYTFSGGPDTQAPSAPTNL
ncbi:MAG: metallophosphoesterase, partial [Chloroflexota bacterium]|nr:metallophosphoesterase [Chloroflexota bacterium]